MRVCRNRTLRRRYGVDLAQRIVRGIAVVVGALAPATTVEREFGRLKHEWSLLPLRVRGLDRVRVRADLTILTKLATTLANQRGVPAAV